MDGFKPDPEILQKCGVTAELAQRKGLAGYTSSHIQLLRHINENKMGWTLILEDDTHFHPQFIDLFLKYWEQVPKDAKIVFIGHCAISHIEQSTELVIAEPAMCTHAYIMGRSSIFIRTFITSK